jgi:hypothetical protein
MKIKLLGYNIDPSFFPSALGRTDIYQHLCQPNGLAVSKTFQVGTTKIPVHTATGTEQWWGGMSLRIRDAKAFNKIVSNGGHITLTAERLGQNEQLAEVNFFIAHPVSGSGLFSYYTGSSSLMSFGGGLQRAFRTYARELRDITLKQTPVKERAAMRKTFAGVLQLGQLCQTKDLKALVAALAKVKTCELKLSRVITKQRIFRGIAQYAESEVIRFALMDDVDPDDFGDEVAAVASARNVESVTVRGVDAHGVPQTYHAIENALSFGEMDYDTMMGNIQLDLNDWPASIKASAIIQKLAATASGHTTNALLTAT